MLLLRNNEVIALHLDLHTETAERIRNDTEILDRNVLDADAGTTHGSHSDKRTHLYHVRQDAMAGTMQFLDAHNGNQIAGNAADLSSHRIEQMAELLDIWFASRIVNGGSTFSQDRSHDDIGCSRNRSLIEQHIAALELLSLNLIHIALLIMDKGSTQILKSQEMGIETTTTYLVATRLGNSSLTTSAEQRTKHEHAAAERRAFLHKLQTIEIVQIQFVTLEGIVVTVMLRHLHTYFLEQLDEVVHIQYVRHIINAHRLIGKDGGTDYLQRLVLGALGIDGTLERMSALYNERLHRILFNNVLLLSFLSVIIIVRQIADRSKPKGVQIQLYLTMSIAGKVRSHLLLISRTMTPLHQVASHLIGCQLYKRITLCSRLHLLEFFKHTEHHGSIMAHRYSLHRIVHRLWFLGYLSSMSYIVRIVDIQLESAHDGKMIPELTVFLCLRHSLWEHTFHDTDDGLSATLALIAVGERQTVIHHLLDFAAIFWQHEFLPLCIVI